MTTKELFEELRTIPSGLGCMDEGCEGCAYEEKERERIEKEIEASIRKEVEEGLIKYADSYIEDKDFNRIWFKAHINLGMESLSKRITLK